MNSKVCQKSKTYLDVLLLSCIHFQNDCNNVSCKLYDSYYITIVAIVRYIQIRGQK